MFSGNFRHPLDNLIRDDSLFMLEAILPFVSDNMKAPLAMYIKIMELQSILSCLQDRNYMESCGLHKDINNQDDILSSLAACGFPAVQGQFANIKKMMDMMKVMEASKEMSGKGSRGSGLFSDLFGTSSSSGNDTEPLYEHYRPNGCENQNSSYADEAQDNPYSNDPQAAHDIHTSDDLYGSIQDLFDEYDRNNL